MQKTRQSDNLQSPSVTPINRKQMKIRRIRSKKKTTGCHQQKHRINKTYSISSTKKKETSRSKYPQKKHTQSTTDATSDDDDEDMNLKLSIDQIMRIKAHSVN